MLSACKKEVDEILIESLPLGAMSKTKYESKYLNIKTGDSILLLSDGMPELLNENNEEIGYQRVKELFRTNGSKSSEEIISALKGLCGKWNKNANLDDDVTFVVIKVK